MFVEEISVKKDDQGTEYVTFEENPTKTQQGGLRKKRRPIQSKLFATGGPQHQTVAHFILPLLQTEIRSVVQIKEDGCQ